MIFVYYTIVKTLLSYNFRESLTIKQCLWLRLFNHPAICSFSYFVDPSKRKHASRLQETLRQDFVCMFPFFWVLKEIIDSEWETARSVLGKNIL